MEKEYDGHRWNYYKILIIKSPWTQYDQFINADLGRSVKPNDIGRYVKRCKPIIQKNSESEKKVFDLVQPGEYGQIFRVKDNHIELLIKDRVWNFPRDNGYIFLN